jgi:starch-binding outer membrane protein, SusD/RagB family
MYKNISKFIFLIIAFQFSACNLLEQESLDNVGEENVFLTASGMRAARGGMYSLLCNENYYGGYYPLMIDAHSDNGATGGYEVVSLDELGAKSLTPANLFVERTWLAIYAANSAANKIITNIDKNEELEGKEAKNIKGEALFIRALTHFDALKLFGEHNNLSSTYGIPVILTPQSVTDIPVRATVSETYDAIMKDLTTADSLVVDTDEKSNIYVTKDAVKALVARVSIFKKDNATALSYAKTLIESKKYALLEGNNFSKLYADRETSESIFELKFEIQNRSAYNGLTYKRPDALRPEVNFFAAADLNNFFKERNNDVRATTIDFINNGADIKPDGRSEKYRGESTQDNPAYVLRYAEILLIAAEAKGYPSGLEDLNTLRNARGLNTLTINEVKSSEAFVDILLDEHRAEFNMEGHRYTDLVRLGKLEAVMGKAVIPAFPIPLREIAASGGRLTQFVGY